MNRDRGVPIFKLPSIAVMIILLCFCLTISSLAASMTLLGVKGAVPLGSTRDQVIKIMGAPDSPLASDYSFTRGKCEIMVIFDDKTGLVESVIVRGKNPKYSIGGITGGSLKSEVEKRFGKPERTFLYKKSGAECWYFPSKKVGFCFMSGRVSSFSTCNCKQ